jgi:hypothetical protein
VDIKVRSQKGLNLKAVISLVQCVINVMIVHSMCIPMVYSNLRRAR